MLNLSSFNKSVIPTTKLAAHVLWQNEDGIIEVVDTFLPSNLDDGFEALKHRVDSYIEAAGLTLADFDTFTESEPGCNSAIFTVRFLKTKYQLNFVEIY
jgi:hypothetical protein